MDRIPIVTDRGNKVALRTVTPSGNLRKPMLMTPSEALDLAATLIRVAKYVYESEEMP